MIFVCSMGDLFHDDVPEEYIKTIFDVMLLADWHVFQVLTKRPERMKSFMENYTMDHDIAKMNHIWGMVTAENQAYADERIPILLQMPFAVRGVSLEPLLSAVDLTPWLRGDGQSLDWTIIGAETGPGHRPCSLEWIESIVRQCREHNIACFVKQLNLYGVVTKNPDEWPLSLRLRQWPKRENDWREQ